LKRRLSTPRAATVIVLAAAVAVSVTVVPSLAQSFLTKQAASKVFVTSKSAKQTYVSNKTANRKFVSKASASSLYLNKKAAANLYVSKKAVPLTPVAGIAAGTTPFSAAATTAGYIPSAFTSFATKTSAAKTIITFSGPASCTTVKAPTPDQSCPVQILVDGTSTGKVNFAPATIEGTAAKPAATNVHTIVQTTVLGKGGHTVSVQYAGASNVTFNLKSWNLAVTAYPEPEEELSFPGEEKPAPTPSK
jgi:hypothetical protein